MQLYGLCVSVTICEKDWTKVLLPFFAFHDLSLCWAILTAGTWPPDHRSQSKPTAGGSLRKACPTMATLSLCWASWWLALCPPSPLRDRGGWRSGAGKPAQKVLCSYKSGFKESQHFKVTDNWMLGLYCCKNYQMKPSYSIVLENQKSF